MQDDRGACGLVPTTTTTTKQKTTQDYHSNSHCSIPYVSQRVTHVLDLRPGPSLPQLQTGLEVPCILDDGIKLPKDQLKLLAQLLWGWALSELHSFDEGLVKLLGHDV